MQDARKTLVAKILEGKPLEQNLLEVLRLTYREVRFPLKTFSRGENFS